MLKVHHYRNWDELWPLRESWNRTLQRSASDTVFLTWQWCEAWWKNYGNDRPLFVLAAWESAELIAVAPLFVEEVRFYGRRWRRLRLIGDGSHDSDYLDCFSQQGRESEAMTAFGDFLDANLGDWDWIELTGPVEDSPTLAGIARYASGKNWHCESERIPCATLPLPKTWEQYLRGLEPRFRTKVRSSLVMLTDYLKTDPEPCSSPRQIDEWLPLLFDLHTRRWKTRNEPGVFRDPIKRRFYAELSRSAFEQGWLAFHRLNWGERTLALQYGLIYRNRFHLLQEGYDPDFWDVRPGVALRAWLMRHWVEASLDEYDFLAGVSDYKLDWGAQEKSSQRLLIAARPVSVLVFASLPRFKGKTRDRLSQLVPATLLSWRKRMIARRKHNQLQGASLQRKSARAWALRLVSTTYSSTVLGRFGRSVAAQYTWSPRSGFRLPLNRRVKPVCQIFQYHRINDDRDAFFGAVPVSTFRAQMRYLAANFPILTLDQVSRGEFRGPYCVAVTFDDGYRDNFVCAFPTLKELEVPATVFLTTGYIDSGRLPWHDQVRLAFKLTMRSRFSVSEVGGPQGDLGHPADRVQFSEKTLGWLRGLPESERKAALEELFRALGVPPDLNLPNHMLRWEDIRQMAKCNVTFGAHSVNHPVFSKISVKELQGEIVGSKKTIEDRLQVPVSHFAYPFGQPFDFSAQAKQIVKEAGFKTAVTTIWGLNEPSDDPFELRRFTPWEHDPAEFQLKVDWYRFSRFLPSQSPGTGEPEAVGRAV